MQTAASKPDQTGEERSPVLVVVLTLVTFGLYGLYWLWSVTQEMERFDPHRESPFALAKWAVGLLLGSFVGYGIGFGSMFAGASSGSGAGMGAGMIFFGLGAVLALVGGILALVAQWRLWNAIEAHERAIGAPSTITPVLMLVLLLVPVVQIVGMLYVPYRTQQGLNRVWSAASQGYEAQPPQRAGDFDQGATGSPGAGAGTNPPPE